jgi:hypothetical protein
MLDMIRRIAPRMPADEQRQVLLAEADAIREGAALGVAIALDRQDVEAAWERVRGSAQVHEA